MRRPVLWILLGAIALGAAPACSGDDGYTVAAEFDRTFNLFTGSRVRVLGVESGKVEEIVFEPGMERVHVTLRLDPGVELPADVQAAIVPGALLGERFVELSPPYTDGPKLEPGATIPNERTDVPAEFDEVLESLNTFLEDLPPDEVARLVTNAAEVLEGRGDTLGSTVEQVAQAVEVLRDNDDAIVALTARLADLNETLSTRDAEIGAIIDDWQTVVGTLAAERDRLDQALGGVARLSDELGSLLADHRQDVEADVRTLTRVGRTAERNIEELDLLLLGQSELYRHAARVFDFEQNWLPLVNHSEGLEAVFADRLENRLIGLCERLGLPECAEPSFWEQGGFPDEVCFAPIALCPDDPRSTPLGVTPPDAVPEPPPVPLPDALRQAIELVPELPDLLAQEEDPADTAPAPESGTILRGVLP